MSPGAILFLLLSWGSVLGLMSWSFATILRVQSRKATSAPPPAS